MANDGLSDVYADFAALMHAVRYLRPGVLALEEFSVADPAPTEVRIRPLAVGICGTDARIVEGAYFARPGVVLGHEIAGTVEAAGSAVRNVREGDLVTVEPHLYCGACRACRLGNEHLCPDKQAFGVHLDGGMADAVVVPGRLAYRLPVDIDPTIGCLTEPLACAVHGMDRLAPRSGLPVLVIGAGPAGLMLASLARLAGLTVVVVEPDAARRGVAERMADALTIDPALPGWQEVAIRAGGGEGFDYVIEASGSPAGLETAVAVAARGGRILVYGVARPDERAAISPYDVYAKELTILGTALNPFTHLRAIELLREIRFDELARDVFPLADYAAAFDSQRDRSSIKVVIGTAGTARS
jgi:threonine dehydrogenase-like Zn-dependent dehydrogenase